MVTFKKCMFFLAQQIRISARKYVFFFIWDPFLGTWAFVALGVGSILAPLDLFCDCSFPSYARFREGTRPTRQKVFPYPTVRTLSASNSPSALSARAGKMLKYILIMGWLNAATDLRALTLMRAWSTHLLTRQVLQTTFGKLEYAAAYYAVTRPISLVRGVYSLNFC